GSAIVAHLWNKVEARLECLEADGVVLATGFERPGRHPLLAELEPYLLTTPAGSYEVGRDYRVRSVPEFSPHIYLQGFCHSTHGLAAPVLSILPARSLEITESILADLEAAAPGRQSGETGVRADGEGSPATVSVAVPVAAAAESEPL